MEDSVLKVRNLTVGEPSGSPVVENVEIEVRKKQMVGIVGESGCGKSMTSMAVMGLLPGNLGIRSGEILFQGKNLETMTEKEIRKIRGKDISMIFQEPSRALHPLHKVGKQIEESLKIHASLSNEERKKKVLELMEAAGISDASARYSQYPHQLSGGLNQRVMIAMALAMNPALLSADEPTTALDVTIQSQILKLLQKLRRERGISIMLISHDLAVISENCDYVYVMYCGEIVEEADAETFFGYPRHPYTRALIAASPDPGKDVEELHSIPGTVPSAEEMPEGCRFADRCPFRTERCVKERPALYRMEDGAGVRCFQYERKKK